MRFAKRAEETVTRSWFTLSKLIEIGDIRIELTCSYRKMYEVRPSLTRQPLANVVIVHVLER